MLTKKMLASCKQFINYCPKNLRQFTGAFYDMENPDVLCLKNPFGVVFFENLTKNEEQEIITTCGNTQTRGYKKFVKTYKAFLETESYPDDYMEYILIDEEQKIVASVKKSDDWKNGTNKRMMLRFINNSCYNRQLMVKTAKCIDNKRVIAHFPKKANNPILIEGKYGKGIVLPINN